MEGPHYSIFTSFTGGHEFALNNSAEQSGAMRMLWEVDPDFASLPQPTAKRWAHVDEIRLHAGYTEKEKGLASKNRQTLGQLGGA
ncbi:hypothetical protein ACOCG7_30740 [Paraburkholderia sp. DD10]|uniref:hypothetical protein n=1 Tax=Paraburkholderia sp. DD10 TaxID=3409691 RepID=UPI003BA3B694